MDLAFFKLNVCKNDLILINYINKEHPQISDFPQIAKKMCNRHSGVGGNGVVFLLSGKEHPVKLSYFLPDGTESIICNDALLCTGRFAFDYGITGKDKLFVETISGIQTIEYIDSNNFRIFLGLPKDTNNCEIIEIPDKEYTLPMKIDDKRWMLTPVYLHKLGCVIFYNRISKKYLKKLSSSLRDVSLFSQTILPVFVRIFSKDEISINSWFFRETIDFSSTAAIALVASVLNGFSDREAIVNCNHSYLYAQWIHSSNKVYITGSAEYTFSGSYYFDE